MRFARAVAFAIAIAAPLAMFLWLQPMKARRGGAVDEARRGGASEAERPTAAEAPLAPPAPRPTREPVAGAPTAKGAWRIELDLRGPDGAQLAKGRVYTEDSSIKLDERRYYFAWQPDAATIDLETVTWTTLIAEAESDQSHDAIPCGDLVSDPTYLNPEAPPPTPLVLRLHFRTGICGRLLGLPDGSAVKGRFPTRCGVRWQKLAAGGSIGATELALSGHDAKLVEVGGGGVAYVVHDLEAGRYAVAARSDPAHPLETPTEVDVGESMVRLDLSLATIDRATMLHAVVQGLEGRDPGVVSFIWVGRARDVGAGDNIYVSSDAPGSYWIMPVEAGQRAQLKRVLDGTLRADETAAVALSLDGAVVAAQPLTSGQREVRFVCEAPARLRVRLQSRDAEGGPRLLLALAPASATALLDAPPAASSVAILTGLSQPSASDSERTFAPLLPGDFVLVTWGQLRSELGHGEVWWPLSRRDVVVTSGEQELSLGFPPLHPLEIRFDRARFGRDVRVQAVLRSFPNWPLGSIPDEKGVARFAALPDGDYTVRVIGDMAGEVDFKLPGTAELRVEPTRREDR